MKGTFDVIVTHVDHPNFYLVRLGEKLNHADALKLNQSEGGTIVPVENRNKYTLWVC